MMEVWDGSMLWGSDAWVKQNRPDLMHTVGPLQWTARVNQLNAEGVTLGGGLLMPFPSAIDRDFLLSNLAVAEAVSGAGPAAVARPVYAVRPNDPRNADMLRTLAETGPPAGIKLWPYMGGYSLHRLLEDQALIDILVASRMLVLMHVGNGRERLSRPAFPDVDASPELALHCAEALGDVPVIIGHVARLCPATLERLARTPNAYVDLSGLTSLRRWFEHGEEGLPVDAGKALAARGDLHILRALVDTFGLGDRLVFGTTWPFCRWWGIDLLDDVELVSKAGLAPHVQKAILRDTLKGLIEAVRWTN